MNKQFTVATLSSIATFLGLSFGLDWNMVVSGLLSGGVYFGVYNVLTPSVKFAGKTLANADALELSTLLSSASSFHTEMENITFNDPALQDLLHDIIKKGRDIEHHLKNNYQDLSQSRHFLSYYVKMARDIAVNYDNMEDLSFSKVKQEALKQKTFESLTSLSSIYETQLENYHKGAITELEIQKDLLEKTLKMGQN